LEKKKGQAAFALVAIACLSLVIGKPIERAGEVYSGITLNPV